MLIDNPLEVWWFNHEVLFLGEKIKNNKNVILNWILKLETIIHGFAGYFRCLLYDKIYISIEPSTYSSNIMSWFPIFFPLVLPVHGFIGDNLQLYLKRKIKRKSIWYEWFLSKPVSRVSQNSDGKQSKISLFKL